MSLSTDLKPYVSTAVRERGAAIYATGKVAIREGDAFEVSAEVTGSQPYEVSLLREETRVIAYCSCPYFDSNGVCKHVWATIMAADRRNHLMGSSGRRVTEIIEDWDGPDDELDDEPFELAPPPEPPRAPAVPGWRQVMDQLPYHARQSSERSDGWPANRELHYCLKVTNRQWDPALEVSALYRDRRKDGNWGKLKGTRIARSAVAQMCPADREMLAMLAGTPEVYDFSNNDSIPWNYRLHGPMAPGLIERLCATGRCRLLRNPDDEFEDQVPLCWDEGEPWQFELGLEREGKAWQLTGGFRRGDERIPLPAVFFIAPEGLLILEGRIARFTGSGAAAWSKLLRANGPIRIPQNEADDFLLHMMNQPDLPPVNWPAEFRYTEISPSFQPHLQIYAPESKRRSSQETLCAYASFDYDGASVPAFLRTAGFFDPSTRTLLKRDCAGEQARLDDLARIGFKPTPPDDSQPHHHIVAKKIPLVIPQLIGSGWRAEIDGHAFRKPDSYRAELTTGVDWFELRADLDFGDAEARTPDLLKALKQKSNVVELSDGSFGLIPDELIEQYGTLLGVGRMDGDHVRYSRSQAVLLDALLATRPSVKVDELFVEARERLREFDRIVPVEQPEGFRGTLRGYQAEGLAWMLFLERLGFGGCLADDMGLGKTAQVLALLERRRAQRAAGEPIGPSLAVVPRSVIYNWKQEAERFTPQLRVLDHSGTARNRSGDGFAGYDLILITYGTLRRDIATLQTIRFDYVILDESQAIKNAGCDSAKAARLLQAERRLALSGTPIENHLGELYSLFEFLNPGMLGSMQALSMSGTSVRNPDDTTRQMLRMAIRPFMLRRTKVQVAPELPERTEQTIYCELERTERKLYQELRDHYRAALLGRIETQGIAKSQMHILEALLRLRQAACHPGLLDDKRTAASSAKIDTLLAQLSEVLSEGHKVLVFSQFTSLLRIVRNHLDREKIAYEYLDGSTQNRQACVEHFQRDRDCPIFLISLKAGGLGLNLTAADYVFLLDPWWNPAVEAQAIDRAHRIGQAKQVFAYRLIARDTVEEKVLELQSRKRDLAESIIRADASLVSNLKREDLEFLLS